ncbi:SERTA domain-containing protein 2-like [Scomber scombrus]|uniref:SERTA domain-containing protein 2-like n=1 Tax=Scomber scombrus TaxID=13677 RepID=UPI002DDB96D6|nr:SERTA domain-containing protein 2-like [Scomber scombrus]
MLGNGVKRKLDEDEDGLDEDRRPPGVGGMSQASYTLQRQTVLNMSLMKLYGPRMGADLNLQRRVLINNIIRRIHDDFRQEGGIGALFFSAATPAAAAALEDASYRQPPPPSSSFSILSSSLSALDSCLTPASLLEEDLPMFFTLPPSSPSHHHHHHHLHHSPRPPLPSPSPKDSFSSALEEIEELCPSSSSSSLTSSSSSSPPSSPPSRVLFDVVMKEEGRGFQEMETRLEKPPPSPPLPPLPPLPPSTTDNSPSSPGAFLTDFALDDVLFTDIDTSMYDLGPCPPPPGAPPTKMSPVVMADDLMRSMSGYGSAGAGTQNQPFKMDLAELDHIMEVLVGS